MQEVDSNSSHDRWWHRLTRVTLALTALAILIFIVMFFSPSFLNRLLGTQKPTSTPATVLSLPTPMPTAFTAATPLPTHTSMATHTTRQMATQKNTPTPTPTRGATPTFPPTWTPVLPTGTPPATRSNYPFALRNNEIIYTRYFFGSDCNWLGIAGLVLDKAGNPVIGLPVVLNGGGFQNHVTYSGNAPAYGESGWEHYLDNKVKEGDFSIQLYSNEPKPISDQIHVRTRADCRGNLIFIVFEQNWDEYSP
jgi:hypothetical protein